MLGSRDFIEQAVQSRRETHPGWKRKTGGTLCRQKELGTMCSLRALRKDVIQFPKL